MSQNDFKDFSAIERDITKKISKNNTSNVVLIDS